MNQADSTTTNRAGRIQLPSCAGVVVFLVLFACSRDAFALDPKKAITQYVHDVWQMKDGLPANNVGAILQTRDGYLWIGTEGGLARFDGVNLKVFNSENTPAMKSSLVRALYEDGAGYLWIGTFGGGLVRYDGGQFTTYTTKDGLSDDRVLSILEDREGNLWLGTHGGLNRFKDGVFTTYRLEVGSVLGPACEDRAGNLWISSGGGLTRFKGGKLTTYTMQDGLPSNAVMSVIEDRGGNLWVGTHKGLARFNDGKFTSYTTKDGLSENYVFAIYEDRAGNLWIATNGGGLNRFRDGKFTSFTTKEGLSDNRVITIYEDREGSLWVGTYGGGLDRFKDGKVTPYTTTEGLSHEWAYSVYEDRAGSLWIGTKGGLTRLRIASAAADGLRNEGANGATVTTYTTKDGLSHNAVRSIYEDRAGNLWIGTHGGGLDRFKDGTFTAYPALGDVRAIHEDRNSDLWIGGPVGKAGLWRFRNGKFIPFVRETGEAFGSMVYVIFDDHEGNLWLGTGSGLERLRDGKDTFYPSGPRLQAMSLYEDREGVLWIGTYGGGLSRFKDGKFTSYSVKEGLHDPVVYQILEDAHGNLWMSGNKGIFRVSKTELNDFADGKITSITSVAFGLTDGMKAIECSGAHQPAGWKTRDGKLWFPTVKGVVMIDPENIPTNPMPPPVYVEEVVVDKTPLEPRGKVEVPPGKKDFEFHYTALSYLDPSKVKFKYKLEGYNSDWVDADTRRVAYFNNLSPGEYRFRVLACNNDGVWNETGAAFEFYLRPRFYQTGWFYTLMGVVLALVGPGIYYVRVQQMRARQRELEMLVEARTKDLAELNQNLEQRVQEGVKALAEAERMAAYGQMVATVAHEVRHPIFGVRTAAYVLKENFEDREQAVAMLETIERETKRMMDVMNDLLEFARPKPLLIAPTDPQQLLEEVAETYRAEHDPQFPNIVLAPNPMVPEITVDRSRLMQVLVNLIQNAAKHAEGLTTVTLSMEVMEGAPHLGGGPAELCIRVRDDGAGIAPEHLPHIFEPFFTTGHGTGLGLAIVQRIVKEHGGMIRAESQPGKGTTFTICLPAKHTENTKGET